MDKQKVQDIAIAEIMTPTLALTQQFLAVNKIVFHNQMPFIEDILLREEEKKAEVYFPIEGEKYYFVVYVDWENLHLIAVAISAGCVVSFLATSDTHSLNELITVAGIAPTRTWEKGKAKRHNGFEIHLSQKKIGDVEDKLRDLLTFLSPHKANLEALSSIAAMGIDIAYWGYKEQMWGIHFDMDLLTQLVNLGLSVDIDIYASGSDLVL